jgi:RNA polymerase sigma-70 factor (ECF subfamily)
MERTREDAFIETVRQDRERLYRVAISIVSSREDAEDAVSAATEQTWKYLQHIQDPDKLPVYLMRCTVNAARSILRKRKKTESIDDYAEILAAPHAGTPVREYVSGLKEKYRLPVILKFQENLREEDIAAVLQLPRGTVSTRITRALKMLRIETGKEE